MSLMGQSCRFGRVRQKSALPPILTVIADIVDGQLGATSGLMQCNKRRHSITSSARNKSDVGMDTPSA
jgi:hypothetical protein